MKRYFKIYGLLIKLNFLVLINYRANFYNSLLANIGWSFFIILSVILLTSRTSSVYGWNTNELLMLAGMYNFVMSFFYLFFARNFNEMSRIIHYGKLDGLLLKPIDTQFLLTTQTIAFANLIRVLVGGGAMIYAMQQLHLSITLPMFGLFSLMTCLSIFILYSLWFLVMCLTMWITNLDNLSNLLYEMNHLSRFPAEMYQGFGNLLFVVIFPLTVVIVTPVKYIINRATLNDFGILILVSLSLFVLGRIVWRFALRSYGSASG